LNFLHQPTAVLVGLEKIAKQTNRPVFYFDVKRVKRGHYEAECIPMCLVPKETKDYEITELFFQNLTRTIQRAPAYWLWSHNRWKMNG
ncbi:MAG: lauroyl acyltransferase, partial [Pedobacter sp.]